MATLGIQQGATWTLQVLSGLNSESAHRSSEVRSGSNPARQDPCPESQSPPVLEVA